MPEKTIEDKPLLASIRSMLYKFKTTLIHISSVLKSCVFFNS